MRTMHGRAGRRILIAVAVAVMLVLAACVGGADEQAAADRPATDASAVEVAAGFVEAFGATDADRAMAYLADDADLSTTDARTVEGLSELLALLRAMGYEQILDSCQGDSSSSAGTNVHCTFAFHAIRSDEIGLGPYGDSSFDLTVEGGKITDATWSWALEEFSPQMWEPFREWVASTHPTDFDVMYVDDGGNFSLSAESIGFWEQRTREYVRAVAEGEQGTEAIIGLPLEGATPSAPEHGKLILHFGGNGSPSTPLPGVELWVYADGRVIWGEGGYFPTGAPTDGATGFVEQHLTPEGVDFLQDQVLSTGLFDKDLAFLRSPDDPGFVDMRVRNGDRLVWLTWADYHVPKDALSPTKGQEGALKGIYALLSDPTSWPAGVWEDQDPQTYVPTTYLVGFRHLLDPNTGCCWIFGERELDMLPAPAAEILLLHGTQVSKASYELSTDDMRALAESLNASGIEPWAIPTGESVLRYVIVDPSDEDSPLEVFVGPVLPHGEGIMLGPG